MLASVMLAAAISSRDAQFVRSAMRLNDGELSRAEVAADSTNLPQRQLAERISADIGAANVALIVIARHYRVSLETLPSPAVGAPSTARPTSRDTLAPAPYFRIEISQLRSAVALYQTESYGGANPEVRGYARTTLNKLREDLALAQRYSREEPR